MSCDGYLDRLDSALGWLIETSLRSPSNLQDHDKNKYRTEFVLGGGLRNRAEAGLDLSLALRPERFDCPNHDT